MKKQVPGIKRLFFIIFTVAVAPCFMVFGIATGLAGLNIIRNQIEVQKNTVIAHVTDSVTRYQEQSVRAAQSVIGMLQDKSLVSDQPELTVFLGSLLDSFDYFESIHIIDAGGTIRNAAPYVPDIIGNDESRQPYYIKGRSGVHWSSAFISAMTGNAGVTLTVPSNDYLCAVFLNLNPIQNNLNALYAGSDISISITDETGTIIADSELGRVLRREKISKDIQGTDLGGYFRVIDPSLGPSSLFPVSLGASGWTLYILYPESVLSEPVRAYALLLVVLLLLSIGSAMVLLVSQMNAIANQLRGFVTATGNVSRGTYSKVQLPERPRELLELAEHFNAMIDDIDLRENTVLQLNAKLEQRVKERTHELETINENLTATLDALKAAQAQLVESEKLAVVGQLVAGVAHEINTPVGISLTASTFLESRSAEVDKRFKDGSLGKQEFEQFISGAIESSQIISRNLERASDLVRSFKQIAVDHSLDDRRSFNLALYLGEVIQNLKPGFKHRPIQIKMEIPQELELWSYPAGFSQILTNLVMNSLTHGFGPDSAGTIGITAGIRDENFVLEYTDTGRGIPENVRLRIFEPFFTTRRQEGSTGLGMHIVYNIVRNQLSGSISCEAVKGPGVRFVLTIPVSMCVRTPQAEAGHAPK